MEIQVTAILLQMLNFGLVAGVLTFFLLKPVRKMLEERAAKIAAGQKAAESALSQEAAIQSLKEKAERDARGEAKKILAEAREDAQERKAALMAEIKEEVAAARQKMLDQLEAEKKAALESLQQDFEQAVLMISERVIGESIDAKKHAALIKQGLKDIATA